MRYSYAYTERSLLLDNKYRKDQSLFFTVKEPMKPARLYSVNSSITPVAQYT